ncbi:Uncharacterised protein [Mycobacteroides abscessus subsp. abscessus]|nr:Uncharacterised protein [Mycobacteroides abscessus subsp. abscessus]
MLSAVTHASTSSGPSLGQSTSLIPPRSSSRIEFMSKLSIHCASTLVCSTMSTTFDFSAMVSDAHSIRAEAARMSVRMSTRSPSSVSSVITWSSPREKNSHHAGGTSHAETRAKIRVSLVSWSHSARRLAARLRADFGAMMSRVAFDVCSVSDSRASHPRMSSCAGENRSTPSGV